MISEIEVDQSETESHVSTSTFVSSPAKRTPPATTPINSKPSKKMMALFDYNPKANSPNDNPTDELSFHSGDIIYVHGNVHDDGFYSGELTNGKKGLVPSNYLKEMPEEIPDNETKVS
jgi:RIMS-binding protein 2